MGKRDERAQRWRGATEDFLARRLGGRAGDWELAAPPSGTTSCIFLARREGAKKCVARLFFKRQGADRYAAKLKIMERLRLPAPRLLVRSRFWEPIFRREPWMLAEEWLDGPMLCDVEIDERLAGDLGRSVGRMHAVTDARFGWGKRRISAGKFNLFCVKLLESRLARARENLSKLGKPLSPQAELTAGRLKQALLDWRFEGPFVFVHGELGPDDMIWLPGRREVAFLDLGSMRFNHRQFDLEFCRDLFDEAHQALWKIFDAAYWEQAGELHRRQAQAEEPLIGGLLDVKRLLTRSEIALNNASRRPSLLARIDSLQDQLLARPL